MLFRFAPGLILTILILTKGSTPSCSITDSFRYFLIKRETVLWFNSHLLPISLYHSQVFLASSRHLTILITFCSSSFLILFCFMANLSPIFYLGCTLTKTHAQMAHFLYIYLFSSVIKHTSIYHIVHFWSGAYKNYCGSRFVLQSSDVIHCISS